MPTPTEEVVEDSEPEREERRQKHEVGKVQRSALSIENRDCGTKEGDRERPLLAAGTTMCRHSRVTTAPAIHDSTTAQMHHHDYGPINSGNPPTRRNSYPQSSSQSLPAQPDAEPEATGSGLRLHHFAHRPVVRSSNSAPPAARPLVSDSATGAVSNVDPAERRTCHPRVRPDPYDLAKADYANLLKCVSCDAAWTIKKSASQKLTHIQSCAKRNGFSDETIRTLIHRDIQAQITVQEKEKRTASQNKLLIRPTTLLDEVVNETTSRKKSIRSATTQTVRSVMETRAYILDRAKAILRNTDPPTSAPAEPSMASAPGESHCQSADDAKEPPLTQPFGQSTLAQSFGGARSTPTFRKPFLTAASPKAGSKSHGLSNPGLKQDPDSMQGYSTKTPNDEAGSDLIQMQRPSQSRKRASPETSREERERRLLKKITDSLTNMDPREPPQKVNAFEENGHPGYH